MEDHMENFMETGFSKGLIGAMTNTMATVVSFQGQSGQFLTTSIGPALPLGFGRFPKLGVLFWGSLYSGL